MRLFAVFFAIVGFFALAHVSYADTKLEGKLRAHVKILSSDDFEGRAPGTEGERKTVAYIAEAWRAAKLVPAAVDSSGSNGWFAPILLVERNPQTAKVSFFLNGHRLSVTSDEFIFTGRESNYTADAVPVFFAGYGTSADGQPIGDVKGKIVLVLAGADSANRTSQVSADERIARLGEAGAEAVILVAAGDEGSWAAARRRMRSKNMWLQSYDMRAPLYGAVSAEFAVALVTAARKDWDGLRRAAAKPDFAGEDLGISASIAAETFVNRFNSMNVIGKIPGAIKNRGAVVFMAHWDHLGICRPQGEPDRICNGAIDNASGIAVLTETARALARKRPDRDIYFVATTAEETGLLGAYSFSANPPVPLDQIVAAFNIDTIAVASAGAKVAIVGRGTTPLDDAITAVANKIGLVVEPSSQANSFLERQDGWALTQKRVPTLMVNSSFSDLPFLEKYLADSYHSPDDELTSDTDLSGTAQDTLLHIALGKYFASIRSFPGIRTGS